MIVEIKILFPDKINLMTGMSDILLLRRRKNRASVNHLIKAINPDAPKRTEDAGPAVLRIKTDIIKSVYLRFLREPLFLGR
jgi:hypothetical protein